MCRMLIITLIICLWLLPASLVRAEFQAGAATSNITPELGHAIIGGFVPFPSRHVHDELHARCLVVDDGATRLALVVCDLLGIDRIVSEEARELIATRHGIPREQVLISATHTHSASSALGKDSRVLNQTADEYQRFVARRIADGVARAINNLRPAELAFGAVEAPEHVFNRRWHMREGTVPVNPFNGTDQVKMNPPAGSENLTDPAGPTDPVVSFLSLRDLEGYPIAVYAAYSLHYVGGVGNGDISADYYAVFCEHLKELLADDARPKSLPPFVAMLANGTSGDINNINFRQPRGRKLPYEQIRYVGEDVAAKVHSSLGDLKYQRELKLAAAYREPEVGLRRPTPEQLAWAEQTLADGKKNDRDLSYIYAQRTLQMAAYPETTTVPVHLLRIGDVSIGTMPFEVFCETGLDFKSRSPFQHAFMVELAHGYYGYLPTPRHHKLGGYETWLGTCRVQPETSEKLLETLLEMAAELQKQP
ncbi:MAG: neutral/alkaline non-lysosomal ceramidase N-terminal domain-containing protein [Planctomycetaceae bacterium]